MNTNAAISELISDWDNVGALDADNSTRRAKILNLLQRIFSDVWNDRPWPFRIRYIFNATVNATLTDVPTDFEEAGPYGGLYLSTQGGGTGEKLDYVNPFELLRVRETGGGATASPGIYSIFGFDTNTNLQFFQFPNNPSSYGVDIFYYAIPATLIDNPVNSGLESIPKEWHEPVIMMGAAAELAMKKGDPMWHDLQAKYERGLARMRARAMPGLDTTQQLPSFFNR